MGYRVGLIGCGRVGALLEEDPLRAKPASHMGGIRKAAAFVNAVSICDINGERLNHCAETWKVNGAYTDYGDLLRLEQPDIVIIATWTHTHAEIALAAVKAGVRGIVLEKPATPDLSSAAEVVTACRDAGVMLVINHERRWDPLYLFARRCVDENRFGPLRAIYANVLSASAPKGDWRDVLKTAGGGPLLHDGSHLADMIRFLAGDITSVSGFVSREDPNCGTETSAAALLKTIGGIPVFLETGGNRDYFNFELDLHFEQGRLKIGNGVREYFQSAPSTRYSGFRDLVKQEFPVLPRESDPFSGALLEIVNALETGATPKSSGDDGYKAMEIVFAVYESAFLGGAPVTLPLTPGEHPLEKMFRAGIL